MNQLRWVLGMLILFVCLAQLRWCALLKVKNSSLNHGKWRTLTERPNLINSDINEFISQLFQQATFEHLFPFNRVSPKCKPNQTGNVISVCGRLHRTRIFEIGIALPGVVTLKLAEIICAQLFVYLFNQRIAITHRRDSNAKVLACLNSIWHLRPSTMVEVSNSKPPLKLLCFISRAILHNISLGKLIYIKHM